MFECTRRSTRQGVAGPQQRDATHASNIRGTLFPTASAQPLEQGAVVAQGGSGGGQDRRGQLHGVTDEHQAWAVQAQGDEARELHGLGRLVHDDGLPGLYM